MPHNGHHPLQLRAGSRIAVVGGGPAGSFFALHALEIARQRRLDIQVVIFEGRDFAIRGPNGCNKCAGILSSRLLRNLHNLQLNLPPQLIMGEIRSYVLHLGDDAVEINQPEPGRRIVSVYRGAGPRVGQLPPTVSFDAWILDEAQKRGAHVIRERVTEVRMSGQPVVVTDTSSLTCDLVVLATGVNSRPVRLPDLKYEPPVTEIMSQDELAVSEMRGNHRVHVYSGHHSGILFAGLVPKGPFVSVSMFGHKLAKDSVGKFLELDHVQSVLESNPKRLCGCNPHIAVSMAHNFFADRFVAIGDGAITRLYKDGVGSAFLTARQAAQVALELGVSEAAFRQGYAPFCKGIQRDNRIGRMLFAIWGRTQRNRHIRQAWLSALTAEEALPRAEQHCRRALWGMFTGDDSYHAIARRLLSLGATSRLAAGFLRAGFSLKQDSGRTRRDHSMQANLGPLVDGARVVIIGGGPGGAACGIALMHMAAAMNRTIQVFLYEGKSFAAESHYNQCVGVLSPPIDRILEDALEIAFPKHLIQRTITGYILHGEKEQILLDGADAPSYAVRRVQFDAYLLDQAQACGVEVIQSRVTDLEFHADRVLVYTESAPREADVVVAAFGLDFGSAHVLSVVTSYRQPRFLDSIVTKVHPPKDFRFGEHIHAYLPPWSQVEFGAITPKGNHLTINVAGAGVDVNWMEHFMDWEPVRSVLPSTEPHHPTNPKDFRYFKGRFPISIAKGFFGDRYVVVGDAAGLVRAFKGKGINSACLSGLWAAETMLTRGISHAAFSEDYARACADTISDLPFGRAVRRMAILGAAWHLMDPLIAVARNEPTLRNALFDSVSGHRPYRAITRDLCRPPVAARLAIGLSRSWLRALRSAGTKESLESTPSEVQDLHDS